MITILTIANVILTLTLIFMHKRIKQIEKGIEDIGTNIGYIQKKSQGIEVSITTSKDEVIKEFNEAYKKALMVPPAIYISKDNKKESRK